MKKPRNLSQEEWAVYEVDRWLDRLKSRRTLAPDWNEEFWPAVADYLEEVARRIRALMQPPVPEPVKLFNVLTGAITEVDPMVEPADYLIPWDINEVEEGDEEEAPPRLLEFKRTIPAKVCPFRNGEFGRTFEQISCDDCDVYDECKAAWQANADGED